ncbi:hypothetical protein C8R47DRAFT_1084948 [Mycena vitilis]|nr:hypothetical protein C8R47DRAFT_1084948 [Mycena vitilis]
MAWKQWKNSIFRSGTQLVEAADRTASGGGGPLKTRRTRSPPHYSGGLSTPPPSTYALRGQESDLKMPVEKAAEPVRPPDRSPGGRPPTPKEKLLGNRDYSTKTGWTENETRVSEPASALSRGSHPRVAYRNAGYSATAGNDPGRRGTGIRALKRTWRQANSKEERSTQVRQSTVGVQELVHPVPKVLPVLELESTQRGLVLIRVRSVELAPRLARLVLAKAPLASATRLVGLPLVGIRVVGAEPSRPTPPTGRQRIRLRGGDLDLRASGGNQRGWRGGCARPLDAGDRRGYRRDDGATGERRGREFPQEPASGMGGGDALPTGDQLLRTWGRTSSSSSSDSTQARCRFLDGILILKSDGRGLAGGSEMKSSSTSIASPAPARGSLGTTGEVGDGTRFELGRGHQGNIHTKHTTLARDSIREFRTDYPYATNQQKTDHGQFPYHRKSSKNRRRYTWGNYRTPRDRVKPEAMRRNNYELTGERIWVRKTRGNNYELTGERIWARKEGVARVAGVVTGTRRISERGSVGRGKQYKYEACSRATSSHFLAKNPRVNKSPPTRTCPPLLITTLYWTLTCPLQASS